MTSTTPDWRSIAERHRANINGKIPPEWRLPGALLNGGIKPIDLPRQCGVMSDWELHITEWKATDILAVLRDRRAKAVDVVRAFCKRAAIAHQATNCVAEFLFEEALAQAGELDKYMEIHGRPKGMLHGLPISVKEHIHMRGTRATCGLIAWAENVTLKDALIVRALRDQGAVFHVKTTNPQTLMAVETESNLFGTTLNPHNPELTCGGSTGGEAALIAMCGSPMGIGTDIGGSIRVPSAFCGIYGLKPSVARLPHSGLSGLHDGMQNIVGAVGPMARSLEDLALFCSAALANRPWDHEPSLIEIPWKEGVKAPSQPKIGVIWNDGVVQPHPPITRALKEVVVALKNQGYTVVDWDSNLHEKLINAADEAYFLDGGKEYREILDKGREPAVPILKWLLDTKAGRQYSVQETWNLNARIDSLRTKYAEQWNEVGVDVLISPVNASVASVHGESRHWGYTSVFNALDYPSVVIPMGKVRPSDTWDPSASGLYLSSTDEWYRQLFDMKSGASRYRDAPIGIQVVGKRLQEEKLLNVAGVIEDSIFKRDSVAVEAHEHAHVKQALDGVARRRAPVPEKPLFSSTLSELDENAAVAA